MMWLAIFVMSLISLNIKQRLTIHFSCLTYAGPHYSPSQKKIFIPFFFRAYLMNEIYKSSMAAEYNFSKEDVVEIADNTLMFIIYHELGHALIDILDIPITGREEDAVDELSAILLLSYYEDGLEMALTAAAVFNIGSEEGRITEDLMFGEHSLDAQRFFNILCMVYGHDPDANADVFSLFGITITEERAYRCILDYDKKRRSWFRLLEPHLR